MHMHQKFTHGGAEYIADDIIPVEHYVNNTNKTFRAIGENMTRKGATMAIKAKGRAPNRMFWLLRDGSIVKAG